MGGAVLHHNPCLKINDDSLSLGSENSKRMWLYPVVFFNKTFTPYYFTPEIEGKSDRRIYNIVSKVFSSQKSCLNDLEIAYLFIKTMFIDYSINVLARVTCNT